MDKGPWSPKSQDLEQGRDSHHQSKLRVCGSFDLTEWIFFCCLCCALGLILKDFRGFVFLFCFVSFGRDRLAGELSDIRRSTAGWGWGLPHKGQWRSWDLQCRWRCQGREGVERTLLGSGLKKLGRPGEGCGMGVRGNWITRRDPYD